MRVATEKTYRGYAITRITTPNGTAAGRTVGYSARYLGEIVFAYGRTQKAVKHGIDARIESGDLPDRTLNANPVPATAHAYGHLVGTTVGIKVGSQIVAATIVDPLPEQYDDFLRVQVSLPDGATTTVPYMATYRADFITG